MKTLTLTKKTKSKILTGVIIALVVLIFAAIMKFGSGKKVVDINSSIKEIVEDLGGKYYKEKKSDEEGYKKDIYISFPSDPVDDEGNSMEFSYEQVTVALSRKMNGSNFRIIDEGRNIINRVKFDDNEALGYTINDNENFFRDEYNKYQLNNNKEKQEKEYKQYDVASKELKYIIDNNWDENIVKKMGTFEKKENDYYYYKEGYRIKYLDNKVFNIIFSKEYKDEIEYIKISDNRVFKIVTGLDNYKVGDDVVRSIDFSSYDGLDMLGWRNQDFYTFMDNGEISIYKDAEYNEQKDIQFGRLIETLSKNYNATEFLDKLTDVYPDYAKYEKEGEGVRITYPTRGLEIVFGINNEYGINIYSNYKGRVSSDIKVDNIKADDKIPNFVFLKLDTNLVRKYDLKRMAEEVVISE